MLKAAEKSPAIIDYLSKRRSVSLKLMGDKRPTDAEIDTILSIAARSPDHGKMAPWYFIVVKDDARKAMGDLLKKAYRADEDPAAEPAKLDLEAERFLRAPMAVIVVSRMREGKNPVWEQILSAGAVCTHLSLAAHALGYGVNWLTEWYAYSPTFRNLLGLDARDNIAGVLYIGNMAEMPEERDRPALSHIVTEWTGEGTPLNKGDANYGMPGKGLPPLRMTRPGNLAD